MNIQQQPDTKTDKREMNNNSSIIINKLLTVLETYNLIYTSYKNTWDEINSLAGDKLKNIHDDSIVTVNTKKNSKFRKLVYLLYLILTL